MGGLLPDVMEHLIFPPGGIFLLLIAGLFIMVKSRFTGTAIISGSIALLYVLSLPATSNFLLARIEPSTSLTGNDLSMPIGEVVVVLGGGRREDASDLGIFNSVGDTVSTSTLERVRYGAWLAKRTKLPVLVTGGLADEDGPAEADMMRKVIEEEYGYPVRWAEDKSRTTFENAKFSSEVLKQAGVKKIYLVTHALHIPRAVWAFSQFGIEVYPAPTAYKSNKDDKLSVRSFLPSARAMHDISAVLHELVGLLWYRLRF